MRRSASGCEERLDAPRRLEGGLRHVVELRLVRDVDLDAVVSGPDVRRGAGEAHVARLRDRRVPVYEEWESAELG